VNIAEDFIDYFENEYMNEETIIGILELCHQDLEIPTICWKAIIATLKSKSLNTRQKTSVNEP